MKGLKMILIILTIVLVLIIGIKLLIDHVNGPTIEEDNLIVPVSMLQEVTDISTFDMIAGYTLDYLGYYRDKNTVALLSILDEEYIDSYEITKDNVLNMVDTYNNEVLINKQVYQKDIDTGNTAYIIYAEKLNIKTDKKEDICCLIRFNYVNGAYSIYPSQYMEDKGISNESRAVDIKTKINSIGKNNFNSIRIWKRWNSL